MGSVKEIATDPYYHKSEDLGDNVQCLPRLWYQESKANHAKLMEWTKEVEIAITKISRLGRNVRTGDYSIQTR